MIQQKHRNSYGYILILLYVALHYISISGIYLQFTRDVLPSGDPFTYTVGFFNLLDLARKDFWEALHRAFTSNWYWLINIQTVLFSPILIKEPFSIAIVNYIMWALASISMFRLCRLIELDFVFSFLATFLIWFFPINFGFLDYTSMPVLGLDSIFFAALQMALFNTFIYALDPQKLKNAIIAGLSFGIAVWGRGNSLIVVGMTIFLPILVVFIQLLKTRRKQLIIPFFMFAIISIAMTSIYFILQGGGIVGYYGHHANFVTRHAWNVHDAMPYFNNLPGFFIWRDENSVPTILITILLHIMTVVSLVMSFKNRKKSKLYSTLYFICVTGVFIYVTTYIINIIFFTDPLMTIYNCLLIYAPMRIGITLSLFTLLATLVLNRKILLKPWLLILGFIFFISYGIIFTKHNTPKAIFPPFASKVEAVAKNIDEILEGKSLSMFWYQSYSPRILNYYRVKNSQPEINFYMNRYYNDIWQQYDYSESKRLKVREELKNHFEEASIILIPEYVDYFNSHFATAFAVMKDEFPKYLNSSASKQFVVRGVLQDRDGMRLLLLQRKTEAKGRGEPLKLPYGLSTDAIKVDYGEKVIRF